MGCYFKITNHVLSVSSKQSSMKTVNRRFSRQNTERNKAATIFFSTTNNDKWKIRIQTSLSYQLGDIH